MRKKITGAIALLDRAFEGDPAYQEAVVRERLNAMVARDIVRLRTKHGLSQSELARLVGTRQSAISRLESANYEGHSITMLEKIASVLHCRVEVRLVSDDEAIFQDDNTPVESRALVTA